MPHTFYLISSVHAVKIVVVYVLHLVVIRFHKCVLSQFSIQKYAVEVLVVGGHHCKALNC